MSPPARAPARPDMWHRIRPSSWIALVVGVGVALGAFGYTRAGESADVAREVRQAEDLAAQRVREQLMLGDTLLASGQGLFAASSWVTAPEFAGLVDALALAERAPAVLSMVFVARVDPGGIDPVLTDPPDQPAFAVADPAPGEDPTAGRAVVTYVSPPTPAFPPGTDVVEPVVIDALAAADAQGHTVAGGPVRTEGRDRFVLVAPVASNPVLGVRLDGWLVLWIDGEAFLGAALAALDVPVDAELTIDGPGSGDTVTLARWPRPVSGELPVQPARVVADPDQAWTIRLVASAGADLVDHSQSLLVLVGGLLLSALTAAVVHLGGAGWERRRIEASLSHQATHDPLTGLPNRVLFVDRVELAIARARRSGRPLAVLFLDLDRFKVVNDSLGHRTGDDLLVEAAARVRRVVRPADTVARFGGDEFVILCEDVDEARTAVDVARRVVTAIEEPFVLADREVFVSASVGICLGQDPDATPHDLLRNADTAMFRVKARGGAREALFDDAMQAWAEDRLETEVALRRAVERRELVVHYQPVVHLDTGEIAAVEALVRWQRPGHGLVGPRDFVPVAEETGLIVPVGTWVLEEACRQVATWQALGANPGLGVTVNMSGRQLVQPDVVDVVAAAVARAGIDPSLVTLEITESVLLDDDALAVDVLGALKGLGVRLAIDDFGTGYSSLTYLRHFPFDVVKVDQSFVQHLGTNVEDSTIVAAVIALSKALGLKVVAEGIETAEHLAALLNLDCDYAQGYYFRQPVPAGEMATLLACGLPSPLAASPVP